MPPGEAIQQYLTGAWRLMLGKRDGVRLLDISADGFWSSFFAIVVALPAMSVSWVAVANTLSGETFGSRFSLFTRLAFADILTWVVPLLLLGAVAGRAGIGRRYVPYVVASNWGSVILNWLLLPPALLQLLWPSVGEFLSVFSLLLFVLAMVLSWRMTNAVLDMGVAMASAVFAGMFVFSLGLLLAVQSLLGITPSP